MSLIRTCDCCGSVIREPTYHFRRDLKSPDGKYLGSVSVYLKTATNSEDICLDCILSALSPRSVKGDCTPSCTQRTDSRNGRIAGVA